MMNATQSMAYKHITEKSMAPAIRLLIAVDRLPEEDVTVLAYLAEGMDLAHTNVSKVNSM